jgi:hypothetical protein
MADSGGISESPPTALALGGLRDAARRRPSIELTLV